MFSTLLLFGCVCVAKVLAVPDNSLLILRLTVREIIDNFEKHVPDELKISDMDLPSAGFVVKNGKVNHLKTLKRKGDVELEEMAGGSYKFTATYTLSPVKVSYEDFKYTYGWFSKSGKLLASFKADNTLTLHLLLPPLGPSMDNYASGKCFIYVDKLEFKSPKLTIDRVYTGGITGGRATTWALPHSESLEGEIQKSVGRAFSEQFMSSVSFQNKKYVCPPGEHPS